MIIAENTQWLAGHGRRMAKRYAEIAAPRRKDNRTGDEIAISVIKKLQKAGITITN